MLNWWYPYNSITNNYNNCIKYYVALITVLYELLGLEKALQVTHLPEAHS